MKIKEQESQTVKEEPGFERYQSDPLTFIQKRLNVPVVTDPVRRVIESVRDNKVTIAVSANGVGKSHIAARLAVWFYRAYPDAQVYTTAAPPEKNLKNILWGEIGAVVRQSSDIFAEDTINNDMRIARHPLSFITGVTIPSSGTPAEREAKFCADAEDLFEMHDGSRVRYSDLVGHKNIPVVSVDGDFRRRWSTAEFFDNGIKTVYEIEFEDGERVRRTGNHPLYSGWDIRPDHHVYDGGTHGKGRIRACKEGWVEVSDLGEGFAVLCPDNNDFVFGSNDTSNDLVKFFGYMIGDGSFLGKKPDKPRLQFTQVDNPQYREFLEVVRNLGARFSVSKKTKYKWNNVNVYSSELIDLTKIVGLANKGSEDKFVPDFVFKLSKEKVSIFLNRLFSTDGWASLSNKAEIGYASKSKSLVYDIQVLLRRFGIRSKVVSKITRWSHNGEYRQGVYWSLFINHAVDIIRFAEQIGIYGKEGAVNACYEYSQSVCWTHAGWKFEKHGYRWKKVVSVKVVGERRTVGVHVPGDNTYLTSLVEHNSGKHAPHMLFIVDEGDAVPLEVYRGIESCMSGGMVRLLIMFNPRADRGAVAQMVKKKQGNIIYLSAFEHPNVITGEDVIPGAVSRDITVERINEMTEALAPGERPDIECYEVPEFLVGATGVDKSGNPYPPIPAGWRRVRSPEFFYKVIGKYPPQSEMQLISRAWVDAATSRYASYVAQFGEKPPPSVIPIIGLDVADGNASTNDKSALTQRWGGWVAPIRAWKEPDADQVAIKSVEILKHLNIPLEEMRVKVDGTGVGAGVAPRMQRLRVARAEKIMVASSPTQVPLSADGIPLGEFLQLRDQLWWSVMLWLRDDRGAMLPPDDDLIEELTTPSYGVFNGKVRVSSKDFMKESLGRSPDKAESLILTFAPDADVAGAW